MGEFSWAYISGGVTTAGPDGSVQFKSGDSTLWDRDWETDRICPNEK